MNRVVQVTTTTPGAGGPETKTVTVAYDRKGNITSKSDVGVYTYGTGFDVADACGGAGPHAVKAVAGSKTASYCYDRNGALISGDGRTVTWSAFGLPTRIAKGVRAIELAYGPDRARFKRIDENEAGLTTTRYIGGGSYEVAITAAGTVTAKIYVGGAAVVIDTETTPGTHTIATRYLLKDHLGSTDVVTDEAGAVLERLSFDAWGRRREVSWKAYIPPQDYAWQGKPITRG